ncbi:hypothetical protein ZHAS_00003310 [Anopheles sinensis]|uniref:Uncharacterized protein n=1 Tax=Anopheles sinensis TaxID=74873 RepID=A0A084VE16_ANOSI|nr:hypothetical protein ZHAS_00003310 [Anopheles sinensis]
MVTEETIFTTATPLATTAELQVKRRSESHLTPEGCMCSEMHLIARSALIFV